MLYLDTCVLLAVLLPEAHSAAAAAFLEEARAQLAISSWSVTEFHSALAQRTWLVASDDGQVGGLVVSTCSARYTAHRQRTCFNEKD